MTTYRAIFLTALLVTALSFAACYFIRGTETQKNPSVNARLDFLSRGGDNSGVVQVDRAVQVTRDAEKARAVLDDVEGNILSQGQTLASVRHVAAATANSNGNSGGNTNMSNTSVNTNASGNTNTSVSYIEGVDADVVIGTIRRGKEKLIQGLEKEEFAGLRAYVNEVYQVPSYSALNIVGRTIDGSTLITPESKDAAFRSALRVTEKIRAIANEAQLSIDIMVVSEPAAADFDMWPPPNGRRRTTLTNSTLDNIYRGYYTFEVSKSGYKPIKQSLNLVDSRVCRLECKLYKTSDSDGPQACKPVLGDGPQGCPHP